VVTQTTDVMLEADDTLPSVTPGDVARRSRVPAAMVVGVAVGLVLFVASLRHVDLGRMNGLGLLSVLPVGAILGVVLIALVFVLGLFVLPRAQPAVLGAALAALVVCLDGVTVFVEPLARFPTAYQIAGYVGFVSKTGHVAPGLAAYFSWAGFFALISFVTGAAGTHGLQTLLRVWPVGIDLLCLPPLFLLMRNLRISWRARWLAGFLFVVGNWVGQDYFSPQSFNYLLYLVFVAILVNWFTDPGRSRARPDLKPSRLARLHRRVFGVLEAGDLPPRPATTGQRAFLLGLLIAIFTVSTISHQLTPFLLIGACVALVLIRRCTLPGLPILFGVILVGYVSFATVGYWSGHRSDVFGALGDLTRNLTGSVGGRIAGSSSIHGLALHARVAVALLIVALAGFGLIRRTVRGMDDRVLVALLCMPLLMFGLANYGGEIALRVYLFMLPPACVLGACLFFPDPQSDRIAWRSLATVGATIVLVGSAVALPVAFLLARYGNEAYEQIPPGELAAANWVYARDAGGVRLLWLSTDPATDNTPEMPWSYQDLSKVDYLPELAPRQPASVAGLVAALRNAGPGSYLIADRTQIAAMQETSSYASDWGRRFKASMAAVPGVRVAYANSTAVIFTWHWPAGAPPKRSPQSTTKAAPSGSPWNWTQAGLVVLGLLLVLLVVREFMCVIRPASGAIRLLTIASLPLLVLLLGDVVLRFVVIT
jgi:hypothetical protein